jgi:regulator of sigma E protease
MIFVHELGHHLMAKFLGIRVDVFSLGFGPRLFGYRKGDTDYRVSLLPLGGYVRMAGEHYDDDLSGSPEEFLSRPKSHRFAVALAGPVMNIFLAVVLLAANFMVGIRVPAYLSEPAIIGFVAEDSAAEQVGLMVGDRVLSVDGTETSSWEGVQLQIATNPGQTVVLEILRDGETFERVITVEESDSSGIGFIGILPSVENVVTQVDPEGPAGSSDIDAGDRILSVVSPQETADELAAILDLIARSEGQTLTFTLRRDQDVIQRTVTPVMMQEKARIGVSIGQFPIQETRLERYGAIESFQRSLERNLQLTSLTLSIVGKLITGQTSLKMMSGPIEIARFSGEAASQGAPALVGFMALISLQLGIFNLFPIPILDGGVIALLLVESLMGRDLSLRTKERIFQVGFIFLILLMSVVILNDISKNI